MHATRQASKFFRARDISKTVPSTLARRRAGSLLEPTLRALREWKAAPPEVPPSPLPAAARRSRESLRPACGDPTAMTHPFENYLTARRREDFSARPGFDLAARSA